MAEIEVVKYKEGDYTKFHYFTVLHKGKVSVYYEVIVEEHHYSNPDFSEYDIINILDINEESVDIKTFSDVNFKKKLIDRIMKGGE